MSRSLTRLKILAASSVADTVVMSSYRRPYRGGRNQGRRGFSDRANRGGRGQILSGDLHVNSVRETNLGFHQGSFSNQSSSQPHQFNYDHSPPFPYDHNQQFQQPPPNQPFNLYQRFRPPFDQNQLASRPHRPRNTKPWDYREWEYSKTPLPPNSERFIVLSYNILADYLANTHRNLYYHIPHHMMNWNWRKRNLMFELGLWSADILCFQEVDKFHDLEEQLKCRGYSGIWKMRTGNAIDGCAIFWRTSRFNLLFEEPIEFNKHELRDNVAQICVLELLSETTPDKTAASLRSSVNKVVICNIHVLYNPRRGEIKLGQVRMLLNRAHAISKSWDDAPVVLCGDFNCTPKSPLYNFISEQKLDLSGIDRDKVSGQASAEIPPPRPYNLNIGARSGDSSVQIPSTVDIKEIGTDKSDSYSDAEKQNNICRNIKDASINNSSHSSETLQDLPHASCNNLQKEVNMSVQYDELITETHQHAVDVAEAEDRSALFMSVDSSNKDLSCSYNEGKYLTDQINDSMQRPTPPNFSSPENLCSDVTGTEHTGADSGGKLMDNHSNRSRTDIELLKTSKSETFTNEDYPPGILGCQSSQPLSDHDSVSYSTPYQVDFSGLSSGIDIDLVGKMDNLSLEDLDKTTIVGGSNVEDDNAFVSALCGDEDAYPTNSEQQLTPDLDQSSKGFLCSQNSQFPLPGEEVLDDLSPTLDAEGAEIEQSTYDPSAWSPSEIAIATGSEHCNFVEHPLQLKSTYTEVKDFPGTRESDGEPLVTSYNRRFLGTVDYIWRSEGLQTVKVLAPFQKQVLQWTSGFPTKKWGSDHIALVSELAFTRGTNHESKT